MPEQLRPLLQPSWKPTRSLLARLADRWLLPNWWVIACCLLSYAAYEQSSAQHRRDNTSLTAQLRRLETEKQQLQSHNTLLEQQLQSQNDPAWIELTLMKVLGTVPEGQQKVYFRPKGGA
jgi:hypothetical protein